MQTSVTQEEAVLGKPNMQAARYRATAKKQHPLARPIATDKCHPLPSAPGAVWQN